MDNNSFLEPGPKTKANDIMNTYPETTDYFVKLGICGCEQEGPFNKSPMVKSLEEIAHDKNIPVEDILEKIKKIIED